MPEKYLYCIIQTDDDDFYVKCNETATYSEIYKNIPRSSELRCIHGSDVPESRELTPGISRELFGHDIVAVANNTAAPPWNYEKFKQHVKTIFKPENLEDCDTTLYICVDKKLIHKRTSENCAIIATQYSLFGCGVIGDNITPWNRVIDSDVNFATRCAFRWLDKANANVWNIDKYYAHLVSLFGDNLIVRDKTESPDPNFANQVHDCIRVMCSKHEGLIVADEDLVLLTQGTYCPWRGITSKQIDDAYARQETPVCTVSKPAYDAQMDMRPKDLFNKLWDLRSAARLCKNCICDDPMQTATVIENITIADRLANELFDAFPEDTVEDEKKDKDTEAE